MNYKEILIDILENGKQKTPSRDGENVKNTIGIFGAVFRHDMSDGTFPLTTLRKMPFKSTCVELEGFLKGKTDKTWYQQKGCKYWDHWSNPITTQLIINRMKPEEIIKYSSIEELWSEKQYENPDLGRLGYSREFREFNGHVDQLKSICNKLKNNPHDRRMVVSFWNPSSLQQTALPACHLLHNIVVYGDTLNLLWHQRSVDMIRNQSICTYALLMLLYCKESGLKPGVLQGTFADCHLYEDQIDAAKTLCERNERELPNVEICKDGEWLSIKEWESEDATITNYNPHPKIDIGKITV